jgi:hypothetical protein
MSNYSIPVPDSLAWQRQILVSLARVGVREAHAILASMLREDGEEDFGIAVLDSNGVVLDVLDPEDECDQNLLPFERRNPANCFTQLDTLCPRCLGQGLQDGPIEDLLGVDLATPIAGSSVPLISATDWKAWGDDIVLRMAAGQSAALEE